MLVSFILFRLIFMERTSISRHCLSWGFGLLGCDTVFLVIDIKLNVLIKCSCFQRFGSLPLHERNSTCVSTPKTPTCISDGESTAVVAAEMFDDNEHERRRSSERFARAVAPRGRRNVGRRRRLVHKSSRMSTEDTDGGGSSKVSCSVVADLK